MNIITSLSLHIVRMIFRSETDLINIATHLVVVVVVVVGATFFKKA